LKSRFRSFICLESGLTHKY